MSKLKLNFTDESGDFVEAMKIVNEENRKRKAVELAGKLAIVQKLIDVALEEKRRRNRTLRKLEEALKSVQGPEEITVEDLQELVIKWNANPDLTPFGRMPQIQN